MYQHRVPQNAGKLSAQTQVGLCLEYWAAFWLAIWLSCADLVGADQLCLLNSSAVHVWHMCAYVSTAPDALIEVRGANDTT